MDCTQGHIVSDSPLSPCSSAMLASPPSSYFSIMFPTTISPLQLPVKVELFVNNYDITVYILCGSDGFV